jgi:hypothetical protein
LPEQTVRFAVGVPAGPHSTVFRAWVPNGKSDLYLAARPIAHTLKVSLHESGRWRMAYTSEFASGDSPLLREPGDRQATVWDRPEEFEPGWTNAFAIIVPSSQLGPAPDSKPMAGAIQWHPDPGPDMETRFYVLFAAPGVTPPSEWPGKESMKTVLVARFDLANGETVWIIAQDLPSEPGNERYLEAMRPEIVRQAGDRAVQPPEGVIRGYLFGNDARGLRFYVDLYIPPELLPTAGED